MNYKILVRITQLLHIMRSFHILPAKLFFLTDPLVVWHRAGSCSCNGLDLYSGGSGFISRPGHQLSCVRFFVFFVSPSTQMPRQYLYYLTATSFQFFFFCLYGLESLACFHSEQINSDIMNLYIQSVVFLGWVIGPSQGHYLHRATRTK
jgi:hypothetical protein